MAGDDSAGTYASTIWATNAYGSYAAQTVEWDVAPAVTVTNPGDQAGTVGAAVSLQLQGADAYGALSYSFAGLPAGLNFSSTGLIYGTLAASGSYTVTVAATDGTYSGGDTFTWNVNAGPIAMTDPEQQSGVEGQVVSLPISAGDADHARLLYTETGLPDGLNINPTTGVIWGTIAVGDAANGPDFVTVTAFGADGAAMSQSFEWDVSSPVTVAAVADQTNAEGDAVSMQVTGADANGALSYSAAGLPAGLSISSTGLITGVIAAGDAADGPYSVTVTAMDGTYSGDQTFTWDVTAPAPPDSPPYVPPPVVPDTGPLDWSARDLALASFAQAGANGFADADDRRRRRRRVQRFGLPSGRRRRRRNATGRVRNGVQ